jgi:UDP-N-acetylmuramate--alanine ligase
MTLSPPFDTEGGPVHFMGISGAGMVSLAELFVRSGVQVTGCDLQPGPAERSLSSWGCRVLSGHSAQHVGEASALIVTAAVPGEHPEIQAAREKGIPVLKRAEALGMWVNRGRVVGVSGTHGKTTTTAMVTEILHAAGLEPTGLVGGRVANWASNLRFGSSDLFVVEADEYDRSFLHLEPSIAVVTNLEADHLDLYGDLEGVREAFRLFLDRVRPDGTVVVCGDDHGASRLLPGLGRRARSYGLNAGSQVRAVDLQEEDGQAAFGVVEDGRDRGRIRLRVTGRHNVRNALGAAVAARCLSVEWDAIRSGLSAFAGVGRRFQIMGEVRGVLVVDDYAHHPTEIRATLEAARERYPQRRIVAVFQPHLFSRTRDFSGEFGEALALADEVWVSEIYPAREAPLPGVTGMLVAQAAIAAGAGAVSFHPDLADLPGMLEPTLGEGDLCLTLGAGSIETLAGDLLQALRLRGSEVRE